MVTQTSSQQPNQQQVYQNRLMQHLIASLQSAKAEGGAVLLVGAGISSSAGIPSAEQFIQIAINTYPQFYTEDELELVQNQQSIKHLQYNHIMGRLSNVYRQQLFKPYIEKAKINFAHLAIAELMKQGYIGRILTVNFDPLLLHACQLAGVYPSPAIYDLGAVQEINAELIQDPSIIYLNGQHVGYVQRTPLQLSKHRQTLSDLVRSTGSRRPWLIAGYNGKDDPLLQALQQLHPYNNWLYWLEHNAKFDSTTHSFLEQDEDCIVLYNCDADQTFLEISQLLKCELSFAHTAKHQLELIKRQVDFSTAPAQTTSVIQHGIEQNLALLNHGISDPAAQPKIAATTPAPAQQAQPINQQQTIPAHIVAATTITPPKLELYPLKTKLNNQAADSEEVDQKIINHCITILEESLNDSDAHYELSESYFRKYYRHNNITYLEAALVSIQTARTIQPRSHTYLKTYAKILIEKSAFFEEDPTSALNLAKQAEEIYRIIYPAEDSFFNSPLFIICLALTNNSNEVLKRLNKLPAVLFKEGQAFERNLYQSEYFKRLRYDPNFEHWYQQRFN